LDILYPFEHMFIGVIAGFNWFVTHCDPLCQTHIRRTFKFYL